MAFLKGAFTKFVGAVLTVGALAGCGEHHKKDSYMHELHEYIETNPSNAKETIAKALNLDPNKMPTLPQVAGCAIELEKWDYTANDIDAFKECLQNFHQVKMIKSYLSSDLSGKESRCASGAVTYESYREENNPTNAQRIINRFNECMTEDEDHTSRALIMQPFGGAEEVKMPVLSLS